MKNLLSLLISATLAMGVLASHTATAQDAACRAADPSIICSGGSGLVHLKYGRFGNSQTGITTFSINPPEVRVIRADSQDKVEIHLQAIGSDFHDTMVTVAGEDIDGEVGPDYKWLSGSGKFSDAGQKIITICVPAVCDADKKYKYDVEVDGFGILDPHVKVEH